MVAYFEDGVAFIRATGNYTAPDAVQTISTSRGLISTHSLVNVGNDLHFGIFTDGWFYLDPSGRFQEVGLEDIGGAAQGKWKDTFYAILSKDPDKRGRLYCHYNHVSNQVYISVPTDGADENEIVWVYDRQSDRVWLDTYEALCFGSYSRQLTGAITYASAGAESPPLTYDNIAPETYASVEARFGLKAMAHGTGQGYIFQQEPDMTSRDKEQASGEDDIQWSYATHHMHSTSARHLLTIDRVLFEHIGLDNTAGMTVTLTDGRPASVVAPTSESVSLTLGTDGQAIAADMIGLSGTFTQYNGRILGLGFSGSGPFMLKSLEADIFDEQVEVFA
jgi:hypothetical protein